MQCHHIIHKNNNYYLCAIEAQANLAQVLCHKFAILFCYVIKVMQIVAANINMFLFLQFVSYIGVLMINYNQPSRENFKQHDNKL